MVAMPRVSDRARRPVCGPFSPSRRFTKLEARSPAMEADAIIAPKTQSSPRIGAASVVQQMETAIPRRVFEAPSRRLPSGSMSPPSSGAAKRSLKSFVAKTGAPFAMHRSNSSWIR